jgi:predicted dehydrogenase
MSLWLIGAGAMAREYAKVLLDLKRDFEVIGRGEASARQFEAATGRPVHGGGLGAALAANRAPDAAIIAVGVDALAGATRSMIMAGTRRILVEKPAGSSTTEIRAVHGIAAGKGVQVLVAYNRRFYASTALARKLIAEDAGATSCTFEFTEWPHVVAPLARPPSVKAAWLLANSTHVIDLAFHLCGFPSDWRAWRSGSLDWHPAAARFCGAGITESGALFSYHADWEAPGRWGVEVLTRRRRLVFRPLEQLHVIHAGSTRMELLEADDSLDKAFKPGLFRQTEAFLNADDRLFCTLEEQLRHCAIYDEMANYGVLLPPGGR